MCGKFCLFKVKPWVLTEHVIFRSLLNWKGARTPGLQGPPPTLGTPGTAEEVFVLIISGNGIVL